MRIRKYLDTCGRGLSVTIKNAFRKFRCRRHPIISETAFLVGIRFRLMIPFKSQETLHVNKGTFSLTFPRFARVDFKVILARVFLQRWVKYACRLCVNAFSCVKGYPSLDSNADSPSLMQEIRSNK